MGGGAVGVPVPHHLQQPPGGPWGDGGGGVGQIAGLDDQVVLRPAGVGAHLGGLGVEKVVVRPQVAGGVRHAADKAGVELLQQGHDLAADAVAGKAIIGVGAVLHVGEAVQAEIVLHLPAGGSEHGPHQISPPGGDARHALESGPPDKVEQQGLGVVVGGVGGGDAVAAQALGSLAQEGVPHVTGGLLQPPALPGGLTGHVAPAHRQLHGGQGVFPFRPGNALGAAPSGRKVPDKGLVPVGLRPPEAVVVVGGNQVEAQDVPQQPQPVEQVHRVRPPGHGAQHPAPPGEHVVFHCKGIQGVCHRFSL